MFNRITFGQSRSWWLSAPQLKQQGLGLKKDIAQVNMKHIVCYCLYNVIVSCMADTPHNLTVIINGLET